jgi:hypothetical protein
MTVAALATTLIKTSQELPVMRARGLREMLCVRGRTVWPRVRQAGRSASTRALAPEDLLQDGVTRPRGRRVAGASPPWSGCASRCSRRPGRAARRRCSRRLVGLRVAGARRPGRAARRWCSRRPGRAASPVLSPPWVGCASPVLSPPWRAARRRCLAALVSVAGALATLVGLRRRCSPPWSAASPVLSPVC